MTQTRRVLTGTIDGISTGIDDRQCEFIPFVPGVELCELWHEAASPIDLQFLPVDAPQFPLMPQPGQVAARIVRFLPVDAATKEAENALLAASGAASTEGGLHRTATLDYNVVQSGSLHLIVETGEVEVRAGDLVVVMGGYHSWENRTDQPANLFSVMLGATSEGEPATADASPPAAHAGAGPRRIVVGLDRMGKSAILLDTALDNPGVIGQLAAVHSLWLDGEMPPSNRFTGDAAEAGMPAPPRDRGTSLWQVEINPGAGDTSVLRAHDTIDFILVTKGEIVYLSEGEEVVLRAGDVAVQKGNRHTWRNDTAEVATISVVHVGIQTLAS